MTATMRLQFEEDAVGLVGPQLSSMELNWRKADLQLEVAFESMMNSSAGVVGLVDQPQSSLEPLF